MSPQKRTKIKNTKEKPQDFSFFFLIYQGRGGGGLKSHKTKWHKATTKRWPSFGATKKRRFVNPNLPWAQATKSQRHKFWNVLIRQAPSKKLPHGKPKGCRYTNKKYDDQIIYKKSPTSTQEKWHANRRALKWQGYQKNPDNC